MLSSAFAGLLLLVAVFDIKKLIIPDFISIAIGVLAVLKLAFNHSNITNAFFGLLVAAVPFLIMRMIKTESIGGGDIKLLAVCGFYLSFDGAVLMVLLSCFLFLCVTVTLKIISKKKILILAFAPFIAVGSLASLILTIFA